MNAEVYVRRVEFEVYIRRVELELRDLPWKQRHDLVAELRGHLAELPVGTDLPAKLGPPEQYAADLRSAAGLERRRGPIAFLRARRPRNLILIVVLLTLIGLAIGAVVWIDRYQPLAFGNAYQAPLGADFGFKGDTFVFHEGRPFIFGMEIANTRRFTVRVLGVPLESYFPWRARLFMSVPNYTGATMASVPFHSFDLKPGERVFLAYKGVWTCPAGIISPGGGFGGEDYFPVRYSFLWRTATAHVRLPEPFEIVFPKGCSPHKDRTHP
ncbi:MAG: hypothetical protein QOG85_2290 [Gaiellaceae bacterium]|nr:hypothetical protein [Gaiellaceae bacterium]